MYGVRTDRNISWFVRLGLLCGVASSWLCCPVGAQEVRNRDVPQANVDPRLLPPTSGSGLGARGINQQVGVLISSVTPGSPAQRAGLEPQDLVINVAGYQVGNVDGVVYDLEREASIRADRNGRVNLLVRDWRTNNFTTITVDLRFANPTLPTNIKPPSSPQLTQLIIWYDKYLQRPPTRSELAAWQDSFQLGGFSLLDAQASLLGGYEFYDRFGRNNDVTYLTALFNVVSARRPSQGELNRWLAVLQRYSTSRVAFVREFLVSEDGTPGVVVGPLSTKQVATGLTSYQKQMSPFVTWGYFGEQSSLVVKALTAVRRIEQLASTGSDNRLEQRRLANDIQESCVRLQAISGLIRERAERTNKRVAEARQLSVESNQLRAAITVLVQELAR